MTRTDAGPRDPRVAEPSATRAGRGSRTVRVPLSRRRIESVISRSIAVFGLVFGAQTVPVLLGQLGSVQSEWSVATIAALFGSLVLAFVASLARRLVRTGHALVAIAYVLVLLSYAVTTVEPVPGDENHWLYFLLTVATATASIAFSTRMATSYLVVVPVLYGLFRIIPAGGGREWSLALLDVIYAIILGGAVMIIVTMLRQASSSVDTAQAMALREYDTAVRRHANEIERVEVDAIVHDSVLTTLLAAASAETRDAKHLAATMAQRAIGHLADAAAAPHDGAGVVPAGLVADDIADAAAALSKPVAVTIRRMSGRAVPASVADALRSAAIQALVNSDRHAGDGTRRWVRVSGVGERGIEVEVGDDGQGFDPETVPRERLGVRVSIIERLASVGGEAIVASAPGEGTIVRMTWLDDRSSSPAAPDLDVSVAGSDE